MENFFCGRVMLWARLALHDGGPWVAELQGPANSQYWVAGSPDYLPATPPRQIEQPNMGNLPHARGFTERRSRLKYRQGAGAAQAPPDPHVDGCPRILGRFRQGGTWMPAGVPETVLHAPVRADEISRRGPVRHSRGEGCVRRRNARTFSCRTLTRPRAADSCPRMRLPTDGRVKTEQHDLPISTGDTTPPQPVDSPAPVAPAPA